MKRSIKITFEIPDSKVDKYIKPDKDIDEEEKKFIFEGYEELLKMTPKEFMEKAISSIILHTESFIEDEVLMVEETRLTINNTGVKITFEKE